VGKGRGKCGGDCVYLPGGDRRPWYTLLIAIDIRLEYATRVVHCSINYAKLALGPMAHELGKLEARMNFRLHVIDPQLRWKFVRIIWPQINVRRDDRDITV
jgi:hypothetical protein